MTSPTRDIVQVDPEGYQWDRAAIEAAQRVLAKRGQPCDRAAALDFLRGHIPAAKELERVHRSAGRSRRGILEGP